MFYLFRIIFSTLWWHFILSSKANFGNIFVILINSIFMSCLWQRTQLAFHNELTCRFHCIPGSLHIASYVITCINNQKRTFMLFEYKYFLSHNSEKLDYFCRQEIISWCNQSCKSSFEEERRLLFFTFQQISSRETIFSIEMQIGSYLKSTLCLYGKSEV